MSKSPKPADTVGAAREQGQQASELNYEQTMANRPNQSNAWGTTEWSNTPVMNPITGKYEMQWTQKETLNPLMQQSVDSQQAITAGRSSLAEGAMARAWGDYSNPMDFSKYGDVVGFNPEAGPQDFNYDIAGGRERAEQAAYERATNRLNPMFDSQQQALETRLRNQGLRQGDQAYDAAMNNFNFGRNDAYEQARLGAVGEGRTEAQQDYSQYANTAQMNAALQGQRYGQGVQNNQIANALRQQQAEEDLFKRNYNLDEVERLLAGQKIEGGPPTTGGQTQSGAGTNQSINTRAMGNS